MYATGYNGTVRTKAELLAWSQWQMLAPQLRAPVLWVLDESVRRGRPVGIGSIGRTPQQADDLARSRHHVVATRGCCRNNGIRYTKNAGQAHAAFSNLTYHVTMTPSTPQYAVAIDFIGDMGMLAELAPKVKMHVFTKVNNEPWHGQGDSYPNGRGSWIDAVHWPLPTITIPSQSGAAAPVRVFAPTPTQKQRTKIDLALGRRNDPVQVKALQYACNFWGWRDVNNFTLLVDGDFGSKTAQAVMVMQRTLRQTSDGQYGPMTAGAFQRFLDAMAALAAGG